MMAGAALDRRKVVAELLKDREGLLVVTGLGSPSYDGMAAGDHDHNYYLWAAMGSAATVGFGLAMAQPSRPVMVLTGDGEMLMGLGALATIAQKKPPNLSIVVLDNEHYGETGMQASHTGRGIALDKIAAACNFDWTTEITDITSVISLRERLHRRAGTLLATIKVRPNNPPRVLPPRDGVHIKNRFRAALGFQPL
jgi:thiamine pyrophosphate-dependent acetolactate synthase large subunit-like protein